MRPNKYELLITELENLLSKITSKKYSLENDINKFINYRVNLKMDLNDLNNNIRSCEETIDISKKDLQKLRIPKIILFSCITLINFMTLGIWGNNMDFVLLSIFNYLLATISSTLMTKLSPAYKNLKTAEIDLLIYNDEKESKEKGINLFDETIKKLSDKKKIVEIDEDKFRWCLAYTKNHSKFHSSVNDEIINRTFDNDEKLQDAMKLVREMKNGK